MGDVFTPIEIVGEQVRVGGQIAIEDFDGDGRTELVLASGFYDRYTVLEYNPEDDRIHEVHRERFQTTGRPTRAVEVGDADGDGRPEFAVHGQGLFLDPHDVPVLAVFEATGDNGTIVSINGIGADTLVLGTTTFAGIAAHSQYPPQDADNFDLSVGASADDQAYVQTVFAVPVTTVFIVEKGGNDSGYIQSLDANGEVVGEMIPFSPVDFTDTGLKGDKFS